MIIRADRGNESSVDGLDPAMGSRTGCRSMNLRQTLERDEFVGANWTLSSVGCQENSPLVRA